MRKIREVLRLKHEQGLSHQAVAQACAVGVGTVNRYLQRAAQRGLGWPLPDDLDDAALEARLFPRAAPVHDRIRPDCAYIHRELKRDSVTLQLLWEEYAQIHPDGYGRTQFCEIYRQWTRRLRPSMRQVHRAGEKTFIDYSGKRPSLVDRRTGELRRVELFVAVLGASSLTYAAATETQQLPDWIDAHIRMVEYFGGATTLWVPDQLKSAITRPCRYEPGVNRTYEDLATHYGAVVVPARPRKPRDKAAVENCVLIAQRWILARLRDQTFFELGPLNAAIRVLLDELNDRPMKKLGVSRRALYEQVDRPALRSLPTARYVLAHWKLCRANIDYHVEVERHVYSVPFQLVREQVEVRYTTNTVEIFYRGKRLTSHRRRYDGQPSTHREHMPSAHRAHAEWTPSRLIRWAEQAGPATGQLVAQIIERRPAPGARVSSLPGDHAPGTAARERPARRGERSRDGTRLLPLSHRQEHSRRRPGPSASGTGGRDNPDAHAHQHPRRRLLRRGHDRGGGPMLIEQTVDKLNAMKLGAMADAVQQQLQSGEAATLGFEERFGLLVDAEWTAREQRKLQRRLQTAKLRHPATLEAVDFTPARRLNRQQVLTLGTCAWLAERHNLIVTGPCGIGKSFLLLRLRRTGVSPRLHRPLRPHAAPAARGGRRPRRRFLHAADGAAGKARPARHRRLDARAVA